MFFAAHVTSSLLQEADDKHKHDHNCDDHEILRIHPQLEHLAVKKALKRCLPEDLNEHLQAILQAERPEKHFPDRDQKEGTDDLERPVQRHSPVETVLLAKCGDRRIQHVPDDDQGKMIHPEEDKAPPRTVPQSVEEPYGKQGDRAADHGTVMISEPFAALFRQCLERRA